ncbi:DUF7927 domain-containing protein [Rhodococcus sp. W8901]|uniref:DUF7927 domain-containing protein n=1 Tax=unclassified Rhodococcus (in: high G+C Gram-positive bacteria) TaxID=192944 RepID=UPI0015824821|nr:hypothetical protein [Rhodococcus sp. W8901]QKT09739.1 hypothetical protein HUN07_02450 [Rhodococcus sp. W8901]
MASFARTVSGLAVAALTATTWGIAAAPAGADPLAAQPGELIVNGDAENGITEWTGTTFASRAYSTGLQPTIVNEKGATGKTFDGGTSYFGVSGNANRKATQVVDLTPSAASIDTGKVTALGGAYLGAIAGQNDRVGVNYTFTDASGTVLGTFSLPAVTNSDRGGVRGFARRDASAPVPVGTRSVTVDLVFTAAYGSLDAYADNISLRLDAAPSELQVTHTADASGPLDDNQVVNYTVTFTNTGAQPLAVDQALALAGLLDDADLVSGPTSSDAALSVQGSVDTFGIAGTLQPGQTVTIVYSVVTKTYAQQGDHNLVSLVAAPSALPGGVPASCTGTADCLEMATADTAAVPLVNPAVAGITAAVGLAGGGVLLLRRRRTGTA